MEIEKFVKKAQLIHGDKYDYSKVEYANYETKVCIICPKHGKFWQSPHVHLCGKACPECGNERKDSRHKDKRTVEFIAKAREHFGDRYDYSKVKYVNVNTKVTISCPEHGEFEQSPYCHLKGQGCPKCNTLKRAKRRTLTTEEFIDKARKVHGDKYDYSKVKYVNNYTAVNIVCREHGEFNQIPANHLKGKGCKECGKKKISEQLRGTTDLFVKKAKEAHGDRYDYSKVNYVNNHTLVSIICPEHGLFTQTPANHWSGSGCPKCGNNAISSKLRLDKETFIKKSTELHGDKYDYSKVDYVNYDTKVAIGCPRHSWFFQTPDCHLHGKGCPKCQHLQSKPELEIIEFLKQYVKPEQILERNREVLDGKEIDILLPDYRVGIEFNGLHWHSFKMKPDRNYHRDKMIMANSKGYRLIQIFEDEWIEHRGIVLNKLRHVINGDVDNVTIGARKCVVGQINKEIAKDFLTTYHIQGYAPSSVYLGAYFNDELVGVMTFTEEQSKMWNLTRFATKTDYKLPGLADKMFKHFLKNYESIEIKSFLDLRWNQSLDGNTVYDKLGFVQECMLSPDYRYIVGSQRLHKFGFRKQILHKKYGLPLTMTEREMCSELGFERIYDCGLAKYVYKNEDR